MSILHIIDRIKEPEIESVVKEESLPHEDSANNIMNDPSFINYIQHNGYHFTDKLANWASSKMSNLNGSRNHWSVDDCMSVANRLGIEIPSSSTKGDFAYSMNMAYADFVPIVLNSETDCAKYSAAIMNDEDGYEGIQFSRWLADAINKNLDVPWGNLT